MKKIIDKVKVFLLKKDLQSIAKYKLLLELQWKILDKQDEDFLKSLSHFKKEREDFLKSKQEEVNKIIERYEKEYKNYFDSRKKKIQDLLKFKLAPWNKVWVMQEFDNNFKEVIITSVSIDEKWVNIYNNMKMYWEYYETEKEAIKEYNKRIENLKK